MVEGSTGCDNLSSICNTSAYSAAARARGLGEREILLKDGALNKLENTKRCCSIHYLVATWQKTGAKGDEMSKKLAM